MQTLLTHIPIFMWRALLAGIGVALVAAPLGAFIVWRKMAYFGDTLAHSGLLGITLALWLNIHPTIGVALIGLLIAITLIGLERQTILPSDTLLGILSHTLLAVGLVVLSLQKNLRLNILGYLYGDILAVSWLDVGVIYLGGIVLILALYFIWEALLNVTIDPTLAQAEGIPVIWVKLIYVCLLAGSVAIAIKVVGVLLITALLVIPPATAKSFSKSPEQLVFMACLLGTLSVGFGLLLSFFFDTPAGPAIVTAAAGLFGVSLFIPKEA
ncbi:MAG TPA: metal ABC transporter permease [Gammaproteobacteria bacterium]|nr:metal ABC transporter permease [Gammaproteobacteria bacterium]